VKQVRIIRDARRPDCLAEMLLEFLALDHTALSPADLEDWLLTIGSCLSVFIEHDSHAGNKSLGAAQWFEMIIIRLARSFPDWPGGRAAIRRTIQAMMWKH
jgi:hypothetical protein